MRTTARAHFRFRICFFCPVCRRPPDEAPLVLDTTRRPVGTRGSPVQYLIAQRYLESLNLIAQGANKTVFIPFEAAGTMAALGGIKEMLTQEGKK